MKNRRKEDLSQHAEAIYFTIAATALLAFIVAMVSV